MPPATAAPTRPDAPPAVAPDGAAGGPRLGVHLGLYALVLVALLVLTPTLRPWSSDDGAYVHATRLVADGRWAHDLPALDLAADPARYPFALSEVDAEGRGYPYAKHPAWIVVLRASTAVAGERVGFVLPNLLGAALAAASAWLLAARLGSRRPQLALWLVGLGPLAVSATSVWAHGAVAGLAGLAVVGTVDLVRRRSLARAAGVGALLAGVVLLRTEGALLALVVVAALAALRPGRWTDLRRLVDPLVAAGVVALAAVGERLWIASLADELRPTGPDAGPPDSWLSGRVLSAWRTLLLGANGERAGELLTIAVLLLAGLAVATVATGRGRGPVAVLLGAAVAAGVARWALYPDGQSSLVSGILPAWPVVAVGLAAWVRHRRAATPDRAEDLVALVAAGFTGLLLLVQYDGGAGTDWGGRYLLAVAVPVGVLAVRGLDGVTGRGLVGVAVAVTAVVTAFGTVVTIGMRADEHRPVATARAAAVDVVISERTFAPRLDLAADAPERWRRPGAEGMEAAVARALDQGLDRVGVLAWDDAGGLDVPGATLVVDEGAFAVYERSAG